MSLTAIARPILQGLGLYDTAGVWVAKYKGASRGIRITQNAARDYQVSDGHRPTVVIGRRHAIYLSDIVVFFDFFSGAVEPDEHNEIHYEKPGWHVPRGRKEPFFFTSFAESRDTLELYSKLVPIRPGDVVFDIGAYCGLSSLYFAENVGETGHTYAFEADPGNFAALEKNAEKSGLKNLTIEHAAVWKESGTVEFQADGTAGASVLSVSTRSNATVKVNSVTLADYIAAKSIQRIDLIKIDVEGAEVEILDASRAVLRQFRPKLIVEVHSVRDVMTTGACVSILEKEGYATSIVPQPGTDFPLMVGTPRGS
jgi:FkbM family methyltransferase